MSVIPVCHHHEDSSDNEDIDVPEFDSFIDVIAYYRKFISGEIQSCPTHGGPLDDETIPIVPQLLVLNKHNILTVDSQPGSIDVIGDATITDLHFGEIDVKKLEVIQRAYVDCYMDRSLCEDLSEELSGTEYIVFEEPYRAPTGETPTVTVPVTISKFMYGGETYNKVESAMPVAWGAPDMICILNGTAVAKKNEIIRDIYSVRIMDTVWGRKTALFDTLVNFLEPTH